MKSRRAPAAPHCACFFPAGRASLRADHSPHPQPRPLRAPLAYVMAMTMLGTDYVCAHPRELRYLGQLFAALAPPRVDNRNCSRDKTRPARSRSSWRRLSGHPPACTGGPAGAVSETFSQVAFLPGERVRP